MPRVAKVLPGGEFPPKWVVHTFTTHPCPNYWQVGRDKNHLDRGLLCVATATNAGLVLGALVCVRVKYIVSDG